MRLLTQIILVSIGSTVGGLTRWGVTVGMARLFKTTFPVGTLFINLTGSLFLGWFMTIFSNRLLNAEGKWWIKPEDLRLMIAVGFTGAYTTFSTFEYEAHSLLGDGDGLAATTYIAGSVFLGLLAIRAGVLLARW